ncbi:hypothetical protein ABWK22_02075 [Gottfriedia acidiceleris]|uniref:hypothetical protein n=1 Tax=Gottfriedia acidiceleris TaxID=371036 RepID=UPI003392BBB9
MDYIREHYDVLLKIHSEWNEKLGHGIPMAPELLADLFGSQINNAMVDVPVECCDEPGTFIDISVGALMNEENPFQVIFVYKVEVHTTTEDSVEVFSLGDEQALIQYCIERGYK